MAARIEPFSPVPAALVEAQLRMLKIKRAKKGRFAARYATGGEQLSLPGWEEPNLF